jgi:hypothetical protein
MGFEITYYYKEASEVFGTYNEEVLSKTSKIGKFNEDISLDVLAGKIIAQLARRNILIIDIEIFEYTKKKISYKETESGILIKNKKFSFDSGALVTSESEEDDDLSAILEDEVLLSKLKKVIMPSPPPVPKHGQINLCKRPPSDNKKVLRQEIYDPELIAKNKVEQRGYKFTAGKKYPIYSEKSLGAGILNYLTKDDSGREVEVSSECFIVPPTGLSFGDNEPQYFGAGDSEVDLWKNVSFDQNMPDVRRG